MSILSSHVCLAAVAWTNRYQFQPACQTPYISHHWWSFGLIIQDRDQDLTIRDGHHPFRDRDLKNPRPRPRPRPICFLLNICLHEKHHFFQWEYFSTRKTSFFNRGYWNLPPTECFFYASILFYIFFFRSCGLDRVVSRETDTFEPRDRDETETFERRDRDETETNKIRSWDLETSITDIYACYFDGWMGLNLAIGNTSELELFNYTQQIWSMWIFKINCIDKWTM